MINKRRALLLAWMAASACLKWTPYAAGATPTGEIPHIRVMQRDGASVDLNRATVTADSVVGYPRLDSDRRIAIAQSNVTQIREGKTDFVQPVVRLAMVAALVGGMFFVLQDEVNRSY